MKVRKTLKLLRFHYDICEFVQLEKEIHIHGEEEPHDYVAMNNMQWVQAKTSVLFWKKKEADSQILF